MVVNTVRSAANLADLLVDRLGLTPPVPVDELLLDRADLEPADWDGNTDAMMVRKGFSRPAVFYKPDGNPQRLRFTLAHELGHLIIPWHIGDLFCKTSKGAALQIRPGNSGTTEREANVFASALLFPRQWLSDRLAEHGEDMEELLAAVEIADASTSATVLALRQALPAGWVLQINHQDQFYYTAGTDWSTAPNECQRGRDHLNRIAKASGQFRSGMNYVRWWRLTESYSLPSDPDELRTDAELIQSAIDATPMDKSHPFLLNVINGKVGGGANNMGGRPAPEIYATLHYRFTAAPELSALVLNDDFCIWLARRSVAISQRGG